jgi:CMP-N-acetylneuraminic acid synthetase
VSTDDAEIASIANAWGAETPFVRPAELANDFTATVPVVAHAIQACEALGWSFDNVCCIYPGVPFIEVEDLKEAFKYHEASSVDYCFPVAEFPSAIQRALKRNSDGEMQPFYPEYQITRTQDLEPAYFDAGQFYWETAATWRKLANGELVNMRPTILSKFSAFDIDDFEDLEFVKQIFGLKSAND